MFANGPLGSLNDFQDICFCLWHHFFILWQDQLVLPHTLTLSTIETDGTISSQS